MKKFILSNFIYLLISFICVSSQDIIPQEIEANKDIYKQETLQTPSIFQLKINNKIPNEDVFIYFFQYNHLQYQNILISKTSKNPTEMDTNMNCDYDYRFVICQIPSTEIAEVDASFYIKSDCRVNACTYSLRVEYVNENALSLSKSSYFI